MSVLLFAFFSYIIIFYPLVKKNERKRCAKALIVYTKHKFGCYLFEPVLVLGRITVKTFAHGFLIYDYTAQITALLLLDFPFIVLAICMRKYFHDRFVFALMTCYLTGFAFLDLFFLSEVSFGWFANWDR